MSKQPRDVTGGERILAGIVPGLGLMNYILGWFTVPVETFLRWNFGERYYTRANFLAGLVLLLLFSTVSSWIVSLSHISIFASNGRALPRDPSPIIDDIIWWYAGFGIFHLATIWWKDVIDHPAHSFYSGKSWYLYYPAKAIIWLVNKLFELIVRLLLLFLSKIPFVSKVVSKNSIERIEQALPIVRDVDTFTERFMEPLFVFVLFLIAVKFGEGTVAVFLFFSLMGLNYNTSARHEAERGYVLDIRDRRMESEQVKIALSGGLQRSGRSKRVERVIVETAKEAERSPEIIDDLKDQNPDLAAAVAAVAARKRKTTQGRSDMEVAA